MGADYVPSGRVSLAAIPLTMLGVPAFAIAGAVYQWVLLVNPYGIANPVITLVFAVMGVGFFTVWTLRLGKVRNRGLALVIAMCLLLPMLFASGVVMRHMQAPKGPITDALEIRRTQGAPLLGGPLAASGLWMWAAWVLEGLCLFLASLFASIVEAGRPFCESCRSWARRGRWRCTVGSPPREALRQMQEARTVQAALEIVPEPGPSHGRLEYVIAACRCGAVATLGVKLIPAGKNGDGASEGVMDDIVLTPASLERVLEWGERINPRLVGRRPGIAVARRARPLEFGSAPADREYTSFFRWTGGPIGASEYWADNQYTKALRERLARGDFELAEQALSEPRSADDRHFIAEACADWRERPGWLEDWAHEAPRSSRMHLVRGIWGCKFAWSARGVDWKPKDHGLFVHRMIEAERDLVAAAELDPADPSPWSWRITASFALQRPVDEVRGLLEQVRSRAPTLRVAHVSMLRYLASKWFGSSEQMFEFARGAAGGAPPGSLLGSLIIEAHLERLGELMREKSPQAEGYWKSPAVVRELLAANEKCFRPGAYRPSMDSPVVRANMAYVLWKAGQPGSAAVHMRIIGPSTPWGPFRPNIPFMKDTLRRARRECGVR